MKFDPEHLDLLRKLRRLPGVATAHIEATGGGCTALEVTMVDGRIVCATNGDALAPDEPWDRWGWVALFPDADGPIEGRSTAEVTTVTEDGPIADGATPRGWDDDAVLMIVRDILTTSDAAVLAKAPVPFAHRASITATPDGVMVLTGLTYEEARDVRLLLGPCAHGFVNAYACANAGAGCNDGE